LRRARPWALARAAKAACGVKEGEGERQGVEHREFVSSQLSSCLQAKILSTKIITTRIVFC